jgi:hypothetical protein
MTLKKCLICCTAAFMLGLIIGSCVIWKLSNRYSIHSVPVQKLLYRCDGLTGRTWYCVGCGQWIEISELSSSEKK